MSYIGNSPGVSSQRVVTEEVISGSAKSAFYPVGGYALGYVDVLINGLEVDSADFTAPDGVVVTLATAAQIGDTVKIKAYIPRGLSDGYLKSEADALLAAKVPLAGGISTGDQRVGATKRVIPRYSASDDTYSGAFAWNALQLGNNGDNFLVAGKTVAGGSLKVYVNNTNEASGGSSYVPNGTFAMEFKNSGDVSIPTGNLVLASGKGIDFSAGSNSSGMTSELLNDYEVGTWTVTLTPATGSITLNPAINTMQYTKVGRLVTIAGRFNIQSISSPSGNLNVSLPFQVADVGASQSCYAAFTVFTHNVDLAAGTVAVFAEAGNGATQATLFQCFDMAAWGALAGNQLRSISDQYFYLTGSYITTA